MFFLSLKNMEVMGSSIKRFLSANNSWLKRAAQVTIQVLKVEKESGGSLMIKRTNECEQDEYVMCEDQGIHQFNFQSQGNFSGDPFCCLHHIGVDSSCDMAAERGYGIESITWGHLHKSGRTTLHKENFILLHLHPNLLSRTKL